MNLTLSLGISNGGGTTRKRKLRDGVVDDVGDRGRVIVRLLQTRERMMARPELDDPRRVVVSSDDDDASGGGIRLMHLLLSSVASGEAGDAHAALQEVYRRASFRGGDPAQRVAAHFADALASRLLRSPLVAAAAKASPSATSTERFLAYTMFYQASPLYQLAHFTANQAILEAFEAGGRRRGLHVIDFDVSYGFQWPSLIQSLSDAAASTTSTRSSSCDGDEPAVSLRITGLGTSADELRQTEARLTRFARGCPNLRFEFEGVVNEQSRGGHDGIIKTDDDATVVLNLVFPDARNSRKSSRECSTLALVRALNPSMVFLVQKHDSTYRGSNATSRGATSLLPRFTASLRYFAAVFDSLHECLPADSAERLAIERNHLGTEISHAIASLDDQHHRRHGDDHTADQARGGTAFSWKEMMERAGFEGVKLSSRTVSQAKLLLKMKSGSGGGGGFRVIEGSDSGKALSLGWRDGTALITATAWRRRRTYVAVDDAPTIQLVNTTAPSFIR